MLGGMKQLREDSNAQILNAYYTPRSYGASIVVFCRDDWDIFDDNYDIWISAWSNAPLKCFNISLHWRHMSVMTSQITSNSTQRLSQVANEGNMKWPHYSFFIVGITRVSVEPVDLCRHMASLGDNELNVFWWCFPLLSARCFYQCIYTPA